MSERQNITEPLQMFMLQRPAYVDLANGNRVRHPDARRARILGSTGPAIGLRALVLFDTQEARHLLASLTEAAEPAALLVLDVHLGMDPQSTSQFGGFVVDAETGLALPTLLQDSNVARGGLPLPLGRAA